MPDNDALERLEKKLDSPTGGDTHLSRVQLFAHGTSAPTAWVRKAAPEVKRAVGKMKPLELFFAGSVIFFVGALLIATLLFFAGNNTISTKNVNVRITGPSEIGAGSTLSLQVVVTNKNAVPMELADLVVEFPEGTRSASDVSTALPRVRESLGTIAPGKSVNRTVRAVLFGEQGKDFPVKASVEYRVPSSNAVFLSDGSYTVRINESPATISVNALTEAVSGQKVSFMVAVRSNSPQVLSDMLLEAVYPPGFSFQGASPAPAAGQSQWNLGDIEPGGERKITITGVFTGEEGEGRVLHLTAGTKKPDTDGIAAPLASSELSLTVTKPFVSVALSLQGDSSAVHTISRGQEITGNVRWVNNLPVRVQNLSIVLSLSGRALDRASVQAGNGFYDSNNSTITWNRSTEGDFSDIAPGESGDQDFSFSVLPASSGDSKNSEIALTVTVSADRLSESNVPESLQTSAAAKAVIATDLKFTPVVSRADGPLPPKAGTPTSFSVSWALANSGSAIGNGQARAVLPSYVTYVGGGGGVSFSETDRTVTWNIGDVDAGASRNTSFQIRMTPSLSQVGTEPDLITGQTLSAIDRFVNSEVRANASDVTTREVSGAGSGTVTQ